GGILRNYAIDHFDRARYQPELNIDVRSTLPYFNLKTLGFNLINSKQTVENLRATKPVEGLYQIARSIIYGFYNAEGIYAKIRGTDYYRTIAINDLGIS